MRNNKRRGIWVILTVIVVIIAGGLLAYHFFVPQQEKPKTIALAADIGNVKSTISATGVLQPLTTVDVKSNVGGTIIQLAVDEGYRVKKGDLIAKIDPSDAQSALAQQNANLEASKAKVDQSSEQSKMQDLQSEASVIAAQQAVYSSQQAVAASQQSLEGARQHLAQAESTAKSQPSLTDAAIRQANSSLASAISSLKQTKEALVPQKLSAAQASLDQAKANLDYANTDLARQRKLYDKGYVSQGIIDAAVQKQQVSQAAYDSAQKAFTTAKTQTDEDLNTAQSKVDQALAALDNAKANAIQDTLKTQDVAVARASVKQAEAALKQTQAGLEQTKASLASAQAGKIQNQMRRKDIIQAQAGVATSMALFKNAVTTLGYTTITAPCNGVVVKKFVDPGSIVAGARTSSLGTGAGVTIIQIADTTRMFALVNVDETDIAKVSLGQDAEITVDAFPDKIFDGKVTKIAPQATVDQNVTTVRVTVEIELPDPRFKPTMNVNCQFIISQKKSVLRVPNEAISGSGSEDDTKAQVKVMTNGKMDNGQMVNGQLTTKTVTIGYAGDSYTEVTGGLNEGDYVLTQTIMPQKAGSTNSSASGSRPPGGMGGMGGPMGGMGGGGMRGR